MDDVSNVVSLSAASNRRRKQSSGRRMHPSVIDLGDTTDNETTAEWLVRTGFPFIWATEEMPPRAMLNNVLGYLMDHTVYTEDGDEYTFETLDDLKAAIESSTGWDMSYLGQSMI